MKEHIITTIANWCWFIFTGILACWVASSSQLFIDKGQWVIALLLSIILFRAEVIK